VRHRTYGLTAFAIAGTAVLFAAGCGGTPSEGSGGLPELRVNQRDFRISAPKHVSAGRVRVELYNKGPDNHELLIVRTDGKELPFRSNGMTVDEDAVEPAVAVALEPEGYGEREALVRLRPGRYMLFCNMSGHYLGGMHRKLTVR
jgi:uncharacterized cupredoxin-like copper-binding protein